MIFIKKPRIIIVLYLLFLMQFGYSQDNLKELAPSWYLELVFFGQMHENTDVKYSINRPLLWETKSGRDFINDKLNNEDYFLQAKAISYVWRFPDKIQAQRLLEESIKSTNPDVIKSSVMSLCYLDIPQSSTLIGKKLVQLDLSNPNLKTTLSTVINCFWRLNDPSSIPYLEYIKQSFPNDHYYVQQAEKTIDLIDRFYKSETSQLQVIEEHLFSKISVKRQWAIEWMKKTGNESYLPSLQYFNVIAKTEAYSFLKSMQTEILELRHFLGDDTLTSEELGKIEENQHDKIREQKNRAEQRLSVLENVIEMKIPPNYRE